MTPTADDLTALLLRRRQSVRVPGGAERSAETDAAVVVLEAELADRGYLLTTPLRRALTALSRRVLRDTGLRLLADIDAHLGTDRHHAPLFKKFPRASVYERAHDRYTSAVVAHLAAQPHQPCMACGESVRRVRALAPCAHLLCDGCVPEIDGCCEECCGWYACPVCEARHETTGPTDPWIEPVHDGDGGPVLRTLRLAEPGDAAAELAALLARRTPLNPQDHDDLVLLLGHLDPAAAEEWLPAAVPLRESKALALAPLLDVPAARPLVARYADTATDVLRLLVVRSGGDPDLLEVPRLRGLPRPVRRDLLARPRPVGLPPRGGRAPGGLRAAHPRRLGAGRPARRAGADGPPGPSRPAARRVDGGGEGRVRHGVPALPGPCRRGAAGAGHGGGPGGVAGAGGLRRTAAG
ncbi:hypothetical protein SALBM135S_07385 [Streptomyces alboniger]